MNNVNYSQASRIEPFGKNLERIPKNRSRDFLRDRTPPKAVIARDGISTTSIGFRDDVAFMSTQLTFFLRENRAMDVVSDSGWV